MGIYAMKASERFAAAATGRPFDRLPLLEWATWWDKTVSKWEQTNPKLIGMNGLDLKRHFGLDLDLQIWITAMTQKTPKPRSHGAPIVLSMKEYNIIKPTLYPEVRLSKEFLQTAKHLHETGEGIVW